MTMNDLEHEHPLVLVVDDDRDVQEKAVAALSQAHLTCHCCTTSEDALAAARETMPDLLLCNVNLRGESGLDLFERLRELPGLAHLQVMFLSGAQLPDIVRRRHAAGGIYCLRKPLDPSVLVELIEQALASQAAAVV
jgi:CheY-like chemotaxis protein